jgi:hypothetical protein
MKEEFDDSEYSVITVGTYFHINDHGLKVYDLEEMVVEFEQKLRELDPSVRLIITFDTR